MVKGAVGKGSYWEDAFERGFQELVGLYFLRQSLLEPQEHHAVGSQVHIGRPCIAVSVNSPVQ